MGCKGSDYRLGSRAFITTSCGANRMLGNGLVMKMSNLLPDMTSNLDDRERWSVEQGFRDREIAVKEGELRAKRRELALKRRDLAASGWRNPLVLAVLAAAIAALGNATVAFVNGYLQRGLENQRSEQLRILEMIKTGDADKAAENLQFLVETGLISDPVQKQQIRQYLTTRQPGGGPVLPAETQSLPLPRGVFGTDAAVAVSTLPRTQPVQAAARAVGRLVATNDGSQDTSFCTAFLVADSLAMTSRVCLQSMAPLSLVLRDGNRTITYPIDPSPVELVPRTIPPDNAMFSRDSVNYALVKVGGNPGRRHGFLRLASTRPDPGQLLAIVMYRHGFDQALAIVEHSECRVLDIHSASFAHRCDTGGGTAGAPILSADGSQVVGIHWASSQEEGMAIRADRVMRMSQHLQ